MKQLISLPNLSDDFIADFNTEEIRIDWSKVDNIPIRQIFTPDGEIKQTKEFVARVSAVDGVWSVDYSHVGFTKIHSVTCTGVSSGTALADKRFISLNTDQPTLTNCAGSMSSSSSVGLLAAMTMVNGSGDFFIHIIGE